MYQSTRSNYHSSDSAAILHGIAPDGGLFVPNAIPVIDYKTLRGLSYEEMAAKIMSAFLPSFSESMPEIVKVYSKKFDTSDITPVVNVCDRKILELWHGPTCAFKDLALSVLPLFMTKARSLEHITEKIVVLTATSGDTGKAALEGFHDVEGTEIVVFFPDGGVSKTQRLQMVTQEGNNVRVYAVKGNFDDCQRGVKEAFAASHEDVFLSSANSINIGRLVPQIVYYFYAYLSLNTDSKVSFVVPTGNFGDILAGYLAKRMGLPVDRLICASNENNVLYDFLTTGTYDRRRNLVKTISPSMDILVSSNLERLLYFASSGDCEYVAYLMNKLNHDGVYTVKKDVMDNIRETFDAAYCSEEKCLNTISQIYKGSGYVADTHTAVAYSASNPGDVVLSTASAFKFSEAVSSAIGKDIFTLDLNVPGALVGLEKKSILHSKVIDKDEIVEVALNK